MATQIAPSLGHGNLFTQGGDGAAPGYDAIDRRRAFTADLQAGVIGATDFKAVQRGAGANMSVDVTMTAGGLAYVAGSSVSGQGLYGVPVHASTVNEAITAAHATLPRIDSVYLQVFDNLHDASGLNKAQTVVVTGTATGGATLDNRTGAGAAPASSLLLADILVPAASVTVVTANIRDRRRWARGAKVSYERVAGDYTTVSAAYVAVDSTNLTRRIECSGAPIRLGLWSSASNTASTNIYLGLYYDGALLGGCERQFTNPAAGSNVAISAVWEFTPGPGSHVLEIRWRTDAGTATLKGGATQGLHFSIEEIARQNAANV